MTRGAIAEAVRFALPPRCPGCGAIVEADHRFCLACWQGLDFLAGPACARCGAPFEVSRGAGALCGGCIERPGACDAVRAAVGYGETARRVALKLKHGGRPGTAETIARAMARLIGAEDAGALIAPVPLHARRLWWRGHNQSALIARALARRHGLALVPDLAARTKATPLLRGLGRKARARAVRGAFAVPARHRPLVKDRRVLLIDDVFTTGATADACAATLKRAGAAEVRLLCWARVLRDSDGE
ncbi:MAG: ComF family protein [Sphingomonadaceae bacterium]|nr:ComF family protein [Sphingomonadaceae bacterium]